MDTRFFVNALVAYLPETLRPMWWSMSPFQRGLRVRVMLAKAQHSSGATAFAARRALHLLADACSADPKIDSAYIAARMTAQVIMMTERSCFSASLALD
jgi:hypothetical protein